MIDVTLIDAARGWHERGSTPIAARAKVPIGGGWQLLDAAAHLARIESEPPPQIGLRMGLQHDGRILIAIDVDGDEGRQSLGQLAAELGPLPKTLAQITGKGGSHLVFEWPPLRAAECPTVSVSKLGVKVDIRGEGGHIVAAPSVHENGRRYEVADADDPAPVMLPDAWVDRIVETHRPPAPATNGPTYVPAAADHDVERCRRYVARMEPAISGSGGHQATWRVVQAVTRGFALGRSDAMTIMREFNGRCQPPWNERQLAHKLDSAEADSRMPRGYLLERDDGWQAGWDTDPSQHLPELLDGATHRPNGATPTGPNRQRPTGGAEHLNGHASQRPPDEPENEPGTGNQNSPAPTRQRVEQRTDLGNARRLIRLHGHELRYFPGRKRWLVWSGVRWVADQTGEIVRRAKATVETMFADAAQLPEQQRSDARKWALSCENQKRIGPMITLAESEPGVPVTAADLDADPWLINSQSGVLDLRTGELSAGDPSLLMTKMCGVPYVPRASSALWDRTVAMLFGDDLELRAYVQRAMGYALFGAWREKSFWFCYGPPDGGKSTFLGVVGDVLGDYHVSVDASTWMVQHAQGGNRGDVTRLLGARLVTTLETRASARFDQQLMKKITGGDTLTAAAKYEAEIEFQPTFALWLGANDRPIIPDDDDGLWQRVRCVPFVRIVPKAEQDPTLREKLTSREHGPAVLGWLLEGCLAWQREGIGRCEAVETATAQYRRDVNQANGFFEECLRRAPGVHALCRDVSSSYHRWARDNNVRQPLTGKRLAQRLRQLGATGGDDESRVRGLRAWHGVELIDEGLRWDRNVDEY